MHKPENKIPTSLYVAVAIVLVGGYFFVHEFISVILFSALAAFLTNPIYKKLLSKLHKRPGLALSLSILIATFVVIIPLLLILFLLFLQAKNFINNIDGNQFKEQAGQLSVYIDHLADWINQLLAKIPGLKDAQVSSASITSSLKNGLLGIAETTIKAVGSVARSIPNLITKFILFIYLLVAMLKYQQPLLRTVHNLSPFGESINRQYLSKMGAMASAMVRGQLVIALIDGFLASLSLYIVGIHLFVFFFMLLAFLSFIPLGAGIVTIPIGIVMIATGNIWQGVFLILFHLLVISNIDNFARPALVSKDAYLNPTLLILSVFAGIGKFGLLGVVYGPIIMIVIVTTIQLYNSLAATKPSFWDRIKKHDSKRAL